MPRHPLLTRILLVALVAGIIVIPLQLIAGKARERAGRAAEVARQFASEGPGPQAIAGPFLALTCEQVPEGDRAAAGSDGRRPGQTPPEECPTVFVAPHTLHADVELPVETLRRGIYPIRTFRARVRLSGDFVIPPPPQSAAYMRRWKEAHVVARIAEPRGIRALRPDAPAADLPAGPESAALGAFTLRDPWGDPGAPGTRRAFRYELDLAGTGSFELLPVGDATVLKMRSDWPHPSFATRWLPDTRAIGEAGFEATWRITRLATGGSVPWAQAIAGGAAGIGPVPGAGVRLVEPIDIYALAYRAAEYGFLFVLFTFAALAVAEALGNVRLHPVQYGLVGCALAVFFLLLLALAEHVAFAHAFLAAAAACVALLTFYLRHPLGNATRTAAFLGLFIVMYGSLYALLRLEDHALLVGSLLVFLALAATMVLTRRVDWGAASLSPARPSAAPGNGAPTAAS